MRLARATAQQQSPVAPATEGEAQEYDEQKDCAGCFGVAIAEIRRRHLAGEVIERTGYFKQ